MKTYVFITYGIVNIGGAQLYTVSKSNFLKKLGWNTIVISADKDGEVLLSELTCFKKNIIPDILIPAHFYASKRKNNIVLSLRKMIPKSEKIIIESNTATLATWGELLAESISAKHIVYILNENIRCPKDLFTFFIFKLLRRELVGISSQSLKIFFSRYFNLNESNSYYLLAKNNINQIVDYEYPLGNQIITKNRITICIIGRYEKQYILETIRDIADFISINRNMIFNILYIGDEERGKKIKNMIEKSYAGIPNVYLYQLGFLFPLPESIIKTIDISIASAGAVLTMANAGITTIAIDARDSKPIGVFGVSTRNTIFRGEEPAIELKDLLSDILLNKSKYIYHPSRTKVSDNIFEPHIDFISQSEASLNYYKNFKLNLTFYNVIKRTLIIILGGRRYISLYKLFRK